jgi:tetratricopeptide (TPR) repeat protein
MRTTLLIGWLVAATVRAASAQDQLDAAKDLYASAAYEEALLALSRVNESAAGAPARIREADEYRAFCLYAMGRTAEAESVAESLIERDPLVGLSAADTSPRVEAMFTAVRRRVLPKLIRDQYGTVRADIDKKQYGAAEPRLAELQRLLTAAEGIGASDEGLADLKLLVEGFLALARANVERAAASPAMPSAGSATGVPPNATMSESEAPAPVATNRAGTPRLYSFEDADVTPPVATFQRAPPVPTQLRALLKLRATPAILLLTIDHTGVVQKAEVRGSIDTSYDDLLVREARAWRYVPAMKQGNPVWYVKPVVIEIR